jgi:uncharacterized protein YcfJ
MPRSYDDDDDYYARQPRRGRDRSPDYYSGGSGRHDAPQRDGPGPEFRDDEPYQREEMTLMPPANHHPRGSSMPPHKSSALAYRDHDRSPSPTYSRSRRSGRSRSSSISSRRSRGGRDESPLSRVRSAVEEHFTNSTTGIGASVIGAMAGGYAANKASGMAFNNNNNHHKEKGRHGRGRHHQRRHSGGDERNVPQAVSTILGAVAGGLGANAIAHRVEESRDKKGSRHQLAWDGGSRRSRDDYDDYDDDYAYDDRRHGDRRHDYDERYDDSRYRRHRDAEEYR